MDDLQSVTDRLAIYELKARYCRTLDTKDWGAFRDLFTQTYELDVSQESGVAVIKGRDEAMELIQSHILNATTAHQVHSPEIKIDGDEAHGIWAMQDRVIFGPNRPSITGYGHYHERYVRQNGQWKIAALKLTRLHIDVHQSSAP
jgi:SnoaL-like domain